MEMRIVGLSVGLVWTQKRIKGEWKQEKMNNAEFEDFMQTEFPEYYREYIESKTYKSPARWFWHYGETEEMEQKGEAFIFQNNT